MAGTEIGSPRRCLESLPLPLEREQSRCQRLSSWPLVAVIAEAKDGTPSGQHEFDEYLIVSYIKLYSLQSHSYVHSIAVPGRMTPEANHLGWPTVVFRYAFALRYEELGLV